jgi:phosphate transport system protein
MSNNEIILDKHISNRYNQELEEIRSKVLEMGGLVEEQLDNGLQSLLKTDPDLGLQVARSDYRVNALEVDIDEQCVQILARRQPAASDLRLVVAITKTIADLERIGDQAERLGKLAIKLSDNPIAHGPMGELRHMGNLVKERLQSTLDAFARLNAKDALMIIQQDQDVDEKFNAIMRQLVTYMMEDPRQIKDMMRVSWCARSLERIGDHTSNICEYIVYLVEGKDIRHTSFEEKVDMLENV